MIWAQIKSAFAPHDPKEDLSTVRFCLTAKEKIAMKKTLFTLLSLVACFSLLITPVAAQVNLEKKTKAFYQLHYEDFDLFDLLAQSEDSYKRVPPVLEPNGITCVQANANNAKYPNIAVDASLIFNGTPPTSTISTMFVTNGPWTWFGPAGDAVSRLFMQGSIQHDVNHVNGIGFLIQGPKSASAVIVTGTSGASNIFPYPPNGVKDDATLEAPFLERITKVEFCVNPSGALAADVSLSGRVVNGKGGGIPRAKVLIQNAATGELVIVNSNSFGYFIADGLDIGLYQVVVTHKAWEFEGPRVMNLMDAVDDSVFVGKMKTSQ